MRLLYYKIKNKQKASVFKTLDKKIEAQSRLDLFLLDLFRINFQQSIIYMIIIY